MKNIVSVVVVATAVVLGILYGLGEFEGKPSVFGLMKNFTPERVQKEMSQYDGKQAFKNGGEGEDRDVNMVDLYYTLSTDFYEYGWGGSFHFAHSLVNEEHEASIKRHEDRLVDEMHIKPGQKVLDIGCGVGGPAREIAEYSQANVMGITINEYQVSRAKNLTEERGLSNLVSFTQGDFTKMPFDSETYDFAYAIEATCHAPQLKDVYAEAFRVLKPGGEFSAYEWITTPDYDPTNDHHNKILRRLEYGNGLPKLRNLKEVLDAAKEVGFELVSEVDLAQDHEGTIPWYSQLQMIKTWKTKFTHLICVITEFLGTAPPGTTTVHYMLLDAADGLLDGGDLNIFTPMHLVHFKKPNTAAAAPVAAVVADTQE